MEKKIHKLLSIWLVDISLVSKVYFINIDEKDKERVSWVVAV